MPPSTRRIPQSPRSCRKPSIDSIPASVSGAKSTRASNSLLSEGVFSTLAVNRSPLSPNVPSCPVAISRAFSLGRPPGRSETTTSGPSSSQRNRGRFAAERSVHSQSSFIALTPAVAWATIASLQQGVQRQVYNSVSTNPHVLPQRRQEGCVHRLNGVFSGEDTLKV